ncbi:efflux RND transporter periplasmic adaptor subunit [Thiolapillus brandeum]|uniref:CzcB-like barrel-sandwich hybrid domain-containing protein n=1 Tax=Thiolapillus brandeum TaxID=1076588 RepID=A0A7U6JI97_9GAMM|nr:biotin/lipoyl-binding protein [Thiolapillus brandeum]BAO45294.1 hypothetical protein TBH_C2384 [Thiolapillus brandeum]
MKAWMLLWLFFLAAQVIADSEVQTKQGRVLPLGTLVSGVVAEVKVQEGQQVKAGEELLILDQREFRARLNRAHAVASRADALFAEALREEERARELYDQGLLSDHELQKAQIGRLEAEARKAEAAEEALQSQLDLERSHVRAPLAGRIVEVRAWKGQPVQNALNIQTLVVLKVAGTPDRESAP